MPARAETSAPLFASVSRRDTDSAGTKYACHGVGETYQDSYTIGSASSVFPCQPEDVITAEKRNLIVNDLMPTAMAWLSRSLSVRPVSGRLVLRGTLSNAACYRGNDRFGFVCCDDQVNPSHTSPGIEGADYVAHVTARPFRGSVVAWAYPCVSDQNGRPVSGQLNFVPSTLSTDPREARMQFIKTLHEFVHNLGFSSDFFPRYRKPGSQTEAIGFGVTQFLFSNALQKPVSSFGMANAVAKMKEHFQCQNWPSDWGVELEDDGGSGTRGKHLEERVFYNELMSGWIHENTVPSAISLAVLEDSGWYKVSYDLAEKLFWGNGEGCSFAQDRCSSWDRRYFCQEGGQSGCTADMRSKALCNAYEVSSTAPGFESKYQYFADNPRKAGKFAGADYCPIFEATRHGDCADDLTPKYWYYGEYTGTGSRCFMGTYQVKQATAPLRRHGGCAFTECDPLTNRVQVTLARGQPKELSLLCPAAGGDVDLSALSSDWTGTVECPRASVLCSGDPCDVQNCNGHGVCQNSDGSCVCSTGFYGDDAFRCNKQRCPANPDSGVECSGHGTCDTSLGLCTDEQGLPGCDPGFKGPDCGTLGCPDAISPDCADPSTPCECSGRGVCTVAGACNCSSGFIASDCGLTDCPRAPSGQRCGGTGQGICDVGTGVCDCLQGVGFDGEEHHFAGSACSSRIVGPRVYQRLAFSGEPSVNGSVGGAVRLTVKAKAYTFLEFDVPSVQYDLKLVVRRAPGALFSPVLPTAVAAYESQGVPSLTNHQFRSAADSSGAQRILWESDSSRNAGADTTSSSDPNGQAPSEFSDIGTMRVALLGFEDADVEVELTRDACAVLQCASYGTEAAGCVNNECQCRRLREEVVFVRTYGFSGLTCAQPDCPGQPDCGGNRGVCAHDGSRSPPTCECNSVFQGEACQNYKLPAGTSIFAASVTASPGSSVAASDAGISARGEYVRGGGPGSVGVRVLTRNSSYIGLRTGVGETATPAFVDPGVSLFFDTSHMTFYARLTVRGGDAGSEAAPEGTDPALVVQTNEVGTLSSYRSFDRSSWIARRRIHEVVGSVDASDFVFLSVINGRYATTGMDFDLFVEVAGGGCPEAIRHCSGHGVGECITGCTCQPGWTGVKCEIPAPLLLSGAIASTPELMPGQWAYFVHRVADAAAEVSIEAQPADGSSPRSAPKLLALFERTVTEASLGKLSSEIARFDFSGVGNSSVTQSITLSRTTAATQRFVVIGVQNMAAAASPVTLHVAVAASRRVTMPLCSSDPGDARCSDPDQALCAGKGKYSVANGVPFCDCDPGWDPDTRCQSPLFTSLNRIASAAQEVEFVCSLCQRSLTLRQDDFFLFKSPQPVQRGASVVITVAAVDSLGRTQAQIDGAGRRLSGVEDALGNPSILVARRLPRSIADFDEILSSRGSSVSATLQDQSETGKLFVAVYANVAGNFSVSMQRSELVYEQAVTKGFVRQVVDWVFGTTRGNIVFAVAALLLMCLVSCCCFDRCAPHCCTSALAGKDVIAEAEDAKLAQQVAAYRRVVAMPSSRVLSRGSSRAMMSRRALSSEERAVPSRKHSAIKAHAAARPPGAPRPPGAASGTASSSRKLMSQGSKGVHSAMSPIHAALTPASAQGRAPSLRGILSPSSGVRPTFSNGAMGSGRHIGASPSRPSALIGASDVGGLIGLGLQRPSDSSHGSDVWRQSAPIVSYRESAAQSSDEEEDIPDIDDEDVDDVELDDEELPDEPSGPRPESSY